MAALDTLITFDAASNTPPATRYATFDTRATADTPVGAMLVLDFDPGATTEFAHFRGVMPGQYDGTSALEVVIAWSSTTGTTGDVKWDVAWKRVASDADDLDTVTFATIQTVTTTTASAAGEVVYSVVDFTNAQADGIQPNESFFLSVERDSADAADTMNSDDAELHTVEVRLN